MEKSEYFDIPINSPLPLRCVVCFGDAETITPVKASEGVPFILEYQIRVKFPCCRTHARRLRNLRYRAKVFLILSVIALLAGPIVGGSRGAHESLWIGAFTVLSAILMWGWLDSKIKFRNESGLHLKTAGTQPIYRLAVKSDQWRNALRQMLSKGSG